MFLFWLQKAACGLIECNKSISTLAQISIRLHTDEHLHVLLINILRIHNCVHERSSATEYHTPRAYHCLHMTFMLQQTICLKPSQAVLFLCIQV